MLNVRGCSGIFRVSSKRIDRWEIACRESSGNASIMRFGDLRNKVVVSYSFRCTTLIGLRRRRRELVAGA
jgi:hypothetical protein